MFKGASRLRESGVWAAPGFLSIAWRAEMGRIDTKRPICNLAKMWFYCFCKNGGR